MGNSLITPTAKLVDQKRECHDEAVEMTNNDIVPNTEDIMETLYDEKITAFVITKPIFKRRVEGDFYQGIFTAAVFLNISELLGPAASTTLLSCCSELWDNTGSWNILCYRLQLSPASQDTSHTEEFISDLLIHRTYHHSVSSLLIGDKAKITDVVNDVTTSRSYVLFVVRTLKNLCSVCGCMWDGYLGSTHPLGFGARQLCENCFHIPGINNVISRSQAKAMYAMKESELPSVTKPQFNHNSFIMSYKVVVPVEMCRQKAIAKHGSILDIALKLYSSKVITIKRASKSIEKREKELYAALHATGYEIFKDNPLCRMYIRPKNYPRKKQYWRGAGATCAAEIVATIHELAFFMKYLNMTGTSKKIDVSYALHIDDDVEFLTILILAEKERMKQCKEKKRIAALVAEADRVAMRSIEFEKNKAILDQESIADLARNGALKTVENSKISKTENQILTAQQMEERNIEKISPKKNTTQKMINPVVGGISRYFGNFVSLVGGRFGIQSREKAEDNITPSYATSSNVKIGNAEINTNNSDNKKSSSSSSSDSYVKSTDIDSSSNNRNENKESSSNEKKTASSNSNSAKTSPNSAVKNIEKVDEKIEHVPHTYSSAAEEVFSSEFSSTIDDDFLPIWVLELPASLKGTYNILRPKTLIEKEKELSDNRLRALARQKAAFGIAACYHPFLASLINGNENIWDSEGDADDDAGSGDY